MLILPPFNYFTNLLNDNFHSRYLDCFDYRYFNCLINNTSNYETIHLSCTPFVKTTHLG